jgi:hypothetical protein
MKGPDFQYYPEGLIMSFCQVNHALRQGPNPVSSDTLLLGLTHSLNCLMSESVHCTGCISSHAPVLGAPYFRE